MRTPKYRPYYSWLIGESLRNQIDRMIGLSGRTIVSCRPILSLRDVSVMQFPSARRQWARPIRSLMRHRHKRHGDRQESKDAGYSYKILHGFFALEVES